ncbi:hypothetical protein [Amaricoccus tamworthensis]|uniref:hypothetical protein n=1 Tax=Amaricoccus tamworthensis TaxID=57002 RepID=UPI003C7BA2FA
MNRDAILSATCALLLCVLPGRPAADASSDGGLFLTMEREVELISHDWLRDVRENPANQLAPFTTDGCSGGMSDIWKLVAGVSDRFVEVHDRQPPWEACCVTHDRAYYLGGENPEPAQSHAARLAADRELRVCVTEVTQSGREKVAEEYGLTVEELHAIYARIADGMYLSVRLGGKPCSGLPWRWGYGWPQCGIAALP